MFPFNNNNNSTQIDEKSGGEWSRGAAERVVGAGGVQRTSGSRNVGVAGAAG